MCQFFAQHTLEQKTFVLYGLGGAGKTQIALKFIAGQTNFTNQFFVDASTTETLKTGLKTITTAMQCGNSPEDALIQLAHKHENWLLFFDNADDPEINLSRFFPRCSHGNIIITSRNPGLQVYGAKAQVSDMEEPDAVALLLKSAVQEPSPANNLHAARIVKELAYLPLAIVQAGAFISKSGTLDTYLSLYLQHRTELLKTAPAQSHDDYAWTVYTTWQISFNRLSQPAAMLLQLCSFIHRDNISEEIFSRAGNYAMKLPDQPQYKPKELKIKFKFIQVVSWAWHSSLSRGLSRNKIPSARKFLLQFISPNSGEWDSFSFLKLITEIKAYSLINFDPERRSFSIHPLVHTWIQTFADAQGYRFCMDAILGMSIKNIPPQDMKLASQRLVLDVDSLMHAIPKLSSDFQYNYAIIYYYAGRYMEAEQLGMREVKKLQKLVGNNHQDTLFAMATLAGTYHARRQFEKAKKLRVTVLNKQQKLLGDEDLKTLTAMNNLAITYHSLGQFEEAKKLQDMVVKKRIQLLGNDHWDTLLAMRGLSAIYDALGEFEEAEKLAVVVLEKQKRLLGKNHLETLLSTHNLGLTYYKCGRFEDARKLQHVVLKMHKKLLGVNHPRTCDAMHNLIKTYRQLGQLAEAAELEKMLRESRRKLHGKI
ncbi:P-loop containing nucleoside triphosphate hydrolase protein [Mycena sanguinolenta]|nr:P-loop containing nucleoside triphosphate hydrolase protein [Mycena sanguinolenta]